jgi:prepilin-type N-terminal cleavage/methylation domain-containing protein
MKKNIVKNNGFTLIELLVVIAIIGILSSIVLASLVSAREKAKNTAITAEVHQLKLALEIYYNDNGSYPIGSDTTGSYPYQFACIGASVCSMSDPSGNGTLFYINSPLSINTKTNQETFIAQIFKKILTFVTAAKQAYADSYFSSFTKLDQPIIYRCGSPDYYSTIHKCYSIPYIYYPQFSGNTTIWNYTSVDNVTSGTINNNQE